MPNQSQGLGNAPADGLTLEQVESVQALVSGDWKQRLADGYAEEQATTAASGAHYLLRTTLLTADACTITDQAGDPTTDPTHPCTQRVNIAGAPVENLPSQVQLTDAQLAILKYWCTGFNPTLYAEAAYEKYFRVASAVDKYGQAGNTGYNPVETAYGTGAVGFSQSIEFRTSSDVIYIRIAGFEPTMSFWVNDRRITGSGGNWSTDGNTYQTDNNGQLRFVKLVFGSKTARTVRIANGGLGGFADIYVRSDAMLVNDAPTRPVWLHMGDSFGTIASDATISSARGQWSVVPVAMAESFGRRRWNFINASVGTTGLVKGAPFSAPVTGSLPNILAQYRIGCRTLPFDVFTALLGHNDFDQSLTAVYDNMVELLTLIKSDRPNALIRIMAANTSSTTVAAANAVEDAIVSACDAQGVTSVRLQNTTRPLWSTASANWLTGTDGTHPKFGASAVSYGQLLAERIARSL